MVSVPKDQVCWGDRSTRILTVFSKRPGSAKSCRSCATAVAISLAAMFLLLCCLPVRGRSLAVLQRSVSQLFHLEKNRFLMKMSGKIKYEVTGKSLETYILLASASIASRRKCGRAGLQPKTSFSVSAAWPYSYLLSQHNR